MKVIPETRRRRAH